MWVNKDNEDAAKDIEALEEWITQGFPLFDVATTNEARMQVILQLANGAVRGLDPHRIALALAVAISMLEKVNRVQNRLREGN